MRTIRPGVMAAAAILLLGGVAAAQNPPRGLVEVTESAERHRLAFGEERLRWQLVAHAKRSRMFDEVAAKRGQGNAEVIPFAAPLRELEQEPTAREIEVLQLISEGLVNREIGQRLFLSEETVKSHVRHLLAKLQARSRAHAVAVGFRRGLIA